MVEKDKINLSDDFQITFALKGLLWSIIITVILAIISALLLQYTALSESLLSGFSTFIFFISIFSGSTIAAYTAQRKGLLYGLTVGCFYFLLTLCGGLLLDSTWLSWVFLGKRLGLTACAGLLGGVIGVGLINK